MESQHETNQPFRVEGSNIVSNSSGKVVATVENGSVVMVSGYNPMTPKVRDFWNEYGSQNSAGNTDAPPAADPAVGENEDEEYWPENEFAKDHTAAAENPSAAPSDPAPAAGGDTNVFVGAVPAAGGTSAPVAEVKNDLPRTYEDDLLLVQSIPEDELPELDPVMGTNTKTFKLFCKLYKLTPEQITILVRKLELKMRG